MNTKVMFSSASDHWSTPTDVYRILDEEFKFTYDPCPLHANFDGLNVDWNGSVFVNPPYSNIGAFITKAQIELGKGNCHTVVFLVPSRTDTSWWHNLVMPVAKEIRFIKGRLKFGNAKNSAPFPSCIIVFKGKNSTEVLEAEALRTPPTPKGMGIRAGELL